VPTRWHPDVNDRGSWADPDIYRHVPVVRIGLDFFSRVKKVYDHFPGRVWTFSSASLGLHAYRMYPKAVSPPEKVYDARQEQLKALGLKIEVYPEPPKTADSKGHHHRRPCGMDSGVITDQGIVADPIEQIRAYMAPQTPSFESICGAVIKRLTDQYECWLAFEGYGKINKGVDRAACWSWQQQEIERVRSWLEQGCPEVGEVCISSSCTLSSSWSIYSDPLRTVGSVEKGGAFESPQMENVPLTGGMELCQAEGSRTAIPAMFLRADLKAINSEGKWVQWIECLARYGFLADDTFMEVITSLTKWLYSVELWDVPEQERLDRIKALLMTYCQIKGNGHISRLLNGDVADVERNVNHLVDSQIASISDQGSEVFEDLRRKRASGRYARVIMVEPLLSSTLSSLRSIYSDPLRKAVSGPELDDTPLPNGAQDYLITPANMIVTN
jgi:hypothetical protein